MFRVACVRALLVRQPRSIVPPCHKTLYPCRSVLTLPSDPIDVASLPALCTSAPSYFTVLFLCAHSDLVLRALGGLAKSRPQTKLDLRLYKAVMGLHARQGQTWKSQHLLSVMHLAGLKPDASCCNIVLFSCVHNRDAMGVETVLRWMELNDVEPDADTYTSMMQNHVWNGDGSRAIQVYQDALQFGVLVGDRMKCLLVTAYLLQGNVDAAKAVYQGAHEEGGLTVELCGVMIDGLCKMGRLKEAVGVYDSMPDCNMIPSIHIYTMLMDAHAKSGDVDGVYQYWNKLKASGLQPDLHTYGVLVWTAFRMQYSYDTAVKLVSEMRREGLTPNAVIVALFVDGLCRAGATEEALKILSSDKEAALPAYTSYMHSLAQSGRQGVKEAYQLFREMTTVKGMEVDVVTFTILIDAQARHKDTLHLAHDLFSDMRKMGLMADATVFNVLLAAHVRFCSVASTLNIFEDMINSGIRPTVETFTILIWMYAREAPRSMRVKEDLAELLHDACDDSQPNADILSFITLARAYARKPSDVTLRRLINEVRHQGVEPDSLMFYHLLIASHGNVSALINVVNEMLSHGVALDSRCRGALKLGGLTVVADDSTIILQETSGERWMCGPNIPT